MKLIAPLVLLAGYASASWLEVSDDAEEVNQSASEEIVHAVSSWALEHLAIDDRNAINRLEGEVIRTIASHCANSEEPCPVLCTRSNSERRAPRRNGVSAGVSASKLNHIQELAQSAKSKSKTNENSLRFVRKDIKNIEKRLSKFEAMQHSIYATFDEETQRAIGSIDDIEGLTLASPDLAGRPEQEYNYDQYEGNNEEYSYEY